MNFQFAIKAGLTQVELAKVLGVSRVTVNHWVNGKMNPHRYIRDDVAHKLCLLQMAIEEGLIPARRNNKGPRHDQIERAIQQAGDLLAQSA